jgi:diguanylate cyclase
MALISGVSGIACLLFFWNTAALERYRMAVHQKTSLNLAVQLAFDSMKVVTSDLKFLGSNREIKSLLAKGDPAVKTELADEYMAFVTQKGTYDQVRLLDAGGQEVVRVNFNDGKPYVVPADQLQSKKGRNYFTEVSGARGKEVFISAFDLNMENNRVERPLKPMIRFSQPILGNDNRFMGALVFNYLGKQILDIISNENRLNEGDLMLVNSDGYWLSSPNPKLEWGFMLPERGKCRFGNSFSKEWRTIAAGEEGQFFTDNGLFAFKALSPGRMLGRSRKFAVKVSPQSQKWLFIHYISKHTLDQSNATLGKNLFILWLAMAFFTAVPAWLFSSAFIKRWQTQKQIWRMANFDSLTGLYNRSSLMRELKQAVMENKRYHRSFLLLYLDLDGFKNINDTLGHAAGDLLLQKTAERFQAALRASDCVARLGGDEFCIIAREIDTVAKASQVAGKLINVLAAPFDLDGKTGRIGTSIGIARFPEDDDTPDGLLRIADQAMYAAKSGGKNRYCFSQPETGSGHPPG